jgi:hypothetical protein
MILPTATHDAASKHLAWFALPVESKQGDGGQGFVALVEGVATNRAINGKASNSLFTGHLALPNAANEWAGHNRPP